MGGVWKKHKYIKKEGDRYYYSKTKSVDDVTGIHSPDLNAVGHLGDGVAPIEAARDFLHTPVWSPNKDEKTLATEAKAKLDNAFNKNKDKKVTEIDDSYVLADASDKKK